MPSRTRQYISIVSGSRREVRLADQLVAGEQLRGPPPRARRASPSSSPRNSTSSAADSGGSSFQSSGVPGMLWLATISAGRDHQLDGAGAGGDQLGHGPTAVGDVGEVKPAQVVSFGGLRHGLEHRLGDERERPL